VIPWGVKIRTDCPYVIRTRVVTPLAVSPLRVSRRKFPSLEGVGGD